MTETIADVILSFFEVVNMYSKYAEHRKQKSISIATKISALFTRRNIQLNAIRNGMIMANTIGTL